MSGIFNSCLSSLSAVPAGQIQIKSRCQSSREAFCVSPAPINGTAADSRSAFSYEVSPSRCVARQSDQDGLTAETNHYVDSSWDVPEEYLQSESWKDSEERRDNLLALGESYKGTIAARVMMEIFDIPKSQGGATVHDTTYQVVAVPSQLKIWIKIPDYQDWVTVDLNPCSTKAKGSSRPLSPS